MRMYNIVTTINAILLCILVSTTILVDAADEAQYNGNDDEVAAAYQQSFTACDNAVITVLDVQLYCDSPGTFYYGSGRYRNSVNCTAGDKGKFLVDFYISQPDTIESNGGNAIVDISAEANAGWYQQSQEVIGNSDLCSLSSLKSLSGSKCPNEGKYRIKSNFYWNKDQDDNNNIDTFKPLLSVGFKSSQYQNTYDYGGANTDYCSGNTFVTNWTNTVKKVYANGIVNFVKSCGILFFTILIMWAFIWFMMKKPTSCGDVGVKLGVMKTDPLKVVQEDSFEEEIYDDSDKFDFNKMRSPRADQNFLDF